MVGFQLKATFMFTFWSKSFRGSSNSFFPRLTLKEKLEENVNMRAMTMLDKAEAQYNDLMRKKATVETDKAKIKKVIEELDRKKRLEIRSAWDKVNKDFGSIFSTLLPGTQAKLKPPDGMDVLDGLEVRRNLIVFFSSIPS